MKSNSIQNYLLTILLGSCLSFSVSADEENDRWTKLCEKGDVSYCNLVGRKFIATGDYQKALSVYKESCSHNSGEGCSWLGNLYMNGQGIRKSLRKANEFFIKSCDLQYGEGCLRLAQLYEESFEFEQYRSKAPDFYSKGCSFGNAEACMNLGALYSEGISVDVDLKRAVKYFDMACGNKNGLGCFNAGEIYSQDDYGIRHDYE